MYPERYPELEGRNRKLKNPIAKGAG